jgi:mannose-6-phosphate isomerase-like protein (cupin superfamily)
VSKIKAEAKRKRSKLPLAQSAPTAVMASTSDRAAHAKERPPLVGNYQVLQDYEVPTASVRVFSLNAQEQSVESHLHRRSMQIYVALAGQVRIVGDGVVTNLRPYEALAVWPRTTHSASAVEGDAVVMNISVPPLAADDQIASSGGTAGLEDGRQ